MKKILFIILLALINYFLINAQNVDNSQKKFGECGTDAIHQMLMQTDPVYRAGILSLEEQIQSILQNPSKLKLLPAVYTIPVVVHVIEDGVFNISDVTIQGAIDGLNARFKNIIDIEIEFCLALRDPDCNLTTGINRVDGTVVTDYATNGIYGSATVNPSGASATAVKDLSIWPYTDYYNIWVVNNIGVFAGYASYPSVENIYDGTVIVWDHMQYSSTTLTHEIGHGFFLYHTFEGDNNGDQCPPNAVCTVDGDKVCDTPPHRRDDCSGTNFCTGGSLSLVSANYMSYCPLTTEFVQGQKDRMRAAAIIAPRESLLSSQGCVGPVAPVSDLSATSICAGLTVNFQDMSANCPNKWIWSFPGGTPSSSTEQNPTVIYNASGTYSVSLTASYETISGNKVTKAIVVYRPL